MKYPSKTALNNLILVVLSTSLLIQCQFRQTTDERTQLIQKICHFLWQAQSPDGAWHSSTHGLLKGGQAYTPFIISTLAQVPDSIYPLPHPKLAQALQFIRQKMHKQLAGEVNLVLEYPVYSAAYSLQVLTLWGNANDKKLRQQLAQYLINQQFGEKRHLSPTHPAYGGWGFGETRLLAGEAGHVDLSITRRVLQALAISGQLNDTILAKARQFLYYTQKNPQDGRWQPQVDSLKSQKRFFDGGFYYSPVVLGANKAKWAEDSVHQKYYRSYATATCDGLLAWLAFGQRADTLAVQSAQKWLLAHSDLHFPAGISPNDPDQWHEVMILYHLAVRAEAYRKLSIKGNWQKSMLEILRKFEQKDGSVLNPAGARNKENDPLLGSALALLALL